MDPFTSANPYEVDPFAQQPTPAQPPAPFVARTPVPADHPLLGVPRNPHITPATAAAAEALGYDPEAVNAPLIRRLGALFVDGAIYAGLLAVLLVLLGVFGPPDAWAAGAVAALFAGPAGFYGYRAMGDAIRGLARQRWACGWRPQRPARLRWRRPRRNLWIRCRWSCLGWIVSLAMMGWIGLRGDPLAAEGTSGRRHTRHREGLASSAPALHGARSTLIESTTPSPSKCGAGVDLPVAVEVEVDLVHQPVVVVIGMVTSTTPSPSRSS